MSKGLGGGAQRERLSSDDAAAAGGEDRLSALPNEVLVLILLKLTTRDAARTSVLSRSWRHIWALLPALSFTGAPEPHWLRDVLDAHQVPVGALYVETDGATPDSLAVWLPAAARRVSGDLFLSNYDPVEDEEEEEKAFEFPVEDEEEEEEEEKAFQFPCFEKATSINLSDFHGLAVPPTGVFSRLTGLHLRRVWFHSPGELGDAVSLVRCPCLQWLTINDARGLRDLTIHSNSLRVMVLKGMLDLSQLTVVAPALRSLTVGSCFFNSRLVANISAPQLTDLDWTDKYDPTSVHLGKMEHLQSLGTHFYLVYGPETILLNQSCLSLLQHFEGINIESLYLTLVCPPLDRKDYQYLMEDMAVLPDITFLHLKIMANGHAFEASAFHVLRLCTGIRSLVLQLFATGSKAQTVCSSDSICIQLQPAEWETEELLLGPWLGHLEEVEIIGWGGTKHEVAFVKRLIDWGTKLKEMKVTFCSSISEVKAKELYQIFQSFSRPGVCMKFYLPQEYSKVLYAPED